MPYRYSHYFVGAVLLVIVAGFWGSYFAKVGGAMPVAFHVHSISSMAWLLLLIVQHLSIHKRKNALHRQMGKASFVLFPFLILGFVMIINVTIASWREGGEFITLMGPAFGIGMVIAIAAYLTLFYLALKHRRNIKLHAGYMLATPVILFESPFSRVIGNYLPWMNVIGSEGPHAILDTIAISDGIMFVFAMALYFMDRKHGAPWLVAAFFVALQAVLMWFGPWISLFATLMNAYAALPVPLTWALGLGLGAGVAWLGWEAGKPPRARPAAAAA
ncbi:hypothetical protein [Erythrobacter sp. MTPC3]|uniref:hypothetical protein n=1 Tax=Erythrobacter sp. MTPC3 TaxID=3056564 RepID=UPI0036F35234